MAMKKKNTTSSNSLGVCEKIFNFIVGCPAIQKIRRISYCPPRESGPHAGGKTIEIHGEDADPDHHEFQAPAKKIEVLPPPPNDQSQKVISEDGRLAISDLIKEKPKPNKAQPEKVILGGQSHGQATKVGSNSKVVSREQSSSRSGREVKSVSKSKGHGKPASDHDLNVAANINEGNKKQGLDPLNDAFSEFINQKKIQMSDAAKNTWGLDGVHRDGNINESFKDNFSDYIHRAKAKMTRSSSSFGNGKNNVSFKKE